MKVQDGGGRHDAVGFGLAAAELGLDEHAEPHHPGILNFDANLGGTNIGIEDGSDIADSSLENDIGVGVEANLGILAERDESQIVLIHVAHDPHTRQIGNGEGVGRSQTLRTGGGRDLLIGDHTSGGRQYVDKRRGVVLVRAEYLQTLGSGFDGNVGLLFGLLRHFEILLGNGALIVQNLGARKLRVGQFLVGHGLAIV